MSQQADEITRLANEIIRHKRLYYAGRPEISDQSFDQLEEQLRRLAPEHPALSYIGTDKVAESQKVAHRRPMLSLQKTYKIEDLVNWAGDYPVMGSWKVDGNSLSVIYEDGVMSLAKTRGNGRFGEDVTEKVRWVSDIANRLDAGVDLEIRGELYCSEHQFALLVDEMIELGLDRPSSPRNIVAGLLGRKSHLHLMGYFNFFAFDLHAEDEGLQFATEEEKFAWLETQGFRLPHPRLLSHSEAIKTYLNDVKEVMSSGEIGVDGAVFSYNEIALHHELGNTSHHPRYKMSFKWQGQTATTVIRDMNWATSRFGVVTPVAVIEPVVLSGATITNVTLHNAEHVKAYNLKVGDQIEIVRSGEVIPKFLEVKQAAPGDFKWPESCSACGSPLSFDGVRLRCLNSDSCPAQQSGAILNWIRSVEIDDISEKRLELMIQNGLVSSPADLYRLQEEDFMSLPLVKEKMAKKLYRNIQNSCDTDLAHFLSGLGIAGTGRTSWEKILEQFPSLQQIRQLTVADIVAIDGFAEKSAQQIATGLKEKSDLIDELLAVGMKPRAFNVRSSKADAVLAGKQLVITGTLSRPRKELEALIKEAGGSCGSAVSGNTFALVANDPDSASSKMRKAKQLGIQIWSEDELFSRIQS